MIRNKATTEKELNIAKNGEKMQYIKLDKDNIDSQHICCAITDKKHQKGVTCKKQWLKSQLEYNHTFYKLNQNGKVFIEYVDSEGAWTPIVAENYIYIHCFWVSGSFKGKGHAKELLSHCVSDAQSRGKSGICILAGSKKTPFLSDKTYLLKAGFEVVDKIDDYELLAYIFDETHSKPKFSDNARKGAIGKNGYVVYHSPQCPYIINCITEIQKVAEEKNVAVEFIEIKTKEQAQAMPCVFNNFAVFYNGKFVTHHLLNGGYFEKLLTAK